MATMDRAQKRHADVQARPHYERRLLLNAGWV